MTVPISRLSVPVHFDDCFVQGYDTCMRAVNGATGGRLEKPKKVYTHKYDLEEYEARLALLDRTIPTPDGELLRHVAGEFYDLLTHTFGPRSKDLSWDSYLTRNFTRHKTWFHERGLGIAELAVFVKIMKGRPNDVPRPHPEAVNELVCSLGEECKNLWDVVRP